VLCSECGAQRQTSFRVHTEPCPWLPTAPTSRCSAT
jgi:hypothetical protein